MSKLAVVIPSRNEVHLTKTVDGIFSATRGPVSVWAVIDGGEWPEDWAATVERHSPNLHTIRFGASHGLRASVNAAVAACQCDAILKCDAHVKFSDGFDQVLLSALGDREVLIPRRLRLDAERWEVINDSRPAVDYEYLTPPNDENGGLKGKIWEERAKERADLLVDDVPLFQGSCWLMKREYFEFLELLDEETYGSFFKEPLEIALKAWLSGGRVRVCKVATYAHWHKQRRGYVLGAGSNEQALAGLRPWLTGKAWHKQTLPFSAYIQRFAMPGWSLAENSPQLPTVV